MTPPSRPPRSPLSGVLPCALGIAAAVLAAHVLGLTLCPLKRLAGIPCPTCGATRACLELLRGHPLRALVIQPYVLAALALLAVLAAFPPLRRAATAFVSRPPGKVLLVLFFLASWLHNLLRGN